MSSKRRLLYWDACVFLYYFNKHSTHSSVLDDILLEVQRSKGSSKIITSVACVTEVAFVTDEETGTLDPATVALFDRFWHDTIIELVDVHDGIALRSRELIRSAKATGSKLKTLDAIHLATAEWAQAEAFYTYDIGLFRYSQAINRPILQPIAMQRSMR